MAAFSDYRILGSVLKTFSLHYEEQAFVFNQNYDLSEGLKSEISFNLNDELEQIYSFVLNMLAVAKEQLNRSN